MQVGIVGPPASGKTTLFNALTRGSAATSAYGGGRREVNVGVIEVPDERFAFLVEHYHPRKVSPATIEFVDGMGGQEARERKGDLGRLLRHSAQDGALALVVRAFEDQPCPTEGASTRWPTHMGSIGLILADLQAAERRLERLEVGPRRQSGPRPDAAPDRGLSAHPRGAGERTHSARGGPPRGPRGDPRRGAAHRKEIVLVLNVGEEQLQTPSPAAAALEAYASEHGYPCISLCAKVERRSLLPPRRKPSSSPRWASPSLAATASSASATTAGLISFFTVGEDEVKAWTIRKGSTAVQAAGKIHTDLARGFIRAEVIPFDRFREAGSWNASKEKGYLRLEGKEYIVQDGDIFHVRFQV